MAKKIKDKEAEAELQSELTAEPILYTRKTDAPAGVGNCNQYISEIVYNGLSEDEKAMYEVDTDPTDNKWASVEV